MLNFMFLFSWRSGSRRGAHIGLDLSCGLGEKEERKTNLKDSALRGQGQDRHIMALPTQLISLLFFPSVPTSHVGPIQPSR